MGIADERRQRFEQLFDEHVGAVSAYVLRRTNAADVDDAVAETFLVAWRRLDELPANAKPWLFGVARRILANQRRAAGRRTALVDRLGGERRTGAVATNGDPPVLAALARLGPSDREILMLTAWDGLAPEEAARVLGCSRSAAKVRLYRARRRLRTALEEIAAKPTTRLVLEECHED